MIQSSKVFKIEVKNGTEAKSYFIDKTSFVLGRGPTSEIKIEDSNVSREHLKIYYDEIQGMCVQDLNSGNGTYVSQKRIQPNIAVAITKNDSIEFGKSKYYIKVDYVSLDPKVREIASEIESTEKLNLIKVDISGYPKDPADIKLDFKNVGLDLPKYKDANEHSQEIIREAEFIKRSILTNALAQKEKVLSDTRSESQKIAEEAHRLYFAQTQSLLNETKNKMEALKIETKTSIDEKRVYAHQELESLWKKHDADIESEKNILLNRLTEENRLKLAVSLESQKKDAFVEREQLLNTAEKSILQKKIEQQYAFENEFVATKEKIAAELKLAAQQLNQLKDDTEEHLKARRATTLAEIDKLWQLHLEKTENEKNRIFKVLETENQIKLELELKKIEKNMLLEREKILKDVDLEIDLMNKKYKNQFEIDQKEHEEKIRFLTIGIEDSEKTQAELLEQLAKLKVVKSESENQIDVLTSQVKTLSEQFANTKSQFDLLNEEYAEKLAALESFKKNKDSLTEQARSIQLELDALNKKIALSSEKKNLIESEILQLSESLAQAKLKNKSEVESEFLLLKKAEQQKFDDFKAQELKELQKIRENHSENIKKISIDLSQEITTSLELQNKKINATGFNFEKNFEIINSIIQVKSSAIGGSESKHKLQIENWKKRQQVEKTKLIFTGFVSAFMVYFSGQFLYSKFSQDSRQIELRQIAAERAQKDTENIYIPVKNSNWPDSYVQKTIYTQDFAEAYLNDDNQREWVKTATMYFLNKWKVSEENTIKVVSNSRALVQNINDAIPKLKKDRLKADLENLNLIEKTNIDEQAQILGSYVRLEAYQKLEKEFFIKKMNSK